MRCLQPALGIRRAETRPYALERSGRYSSVLTDKRGISITVLRNEGLVPGSPLSDVGIVAHAVLKDRRVVVRSGLVHASPIVVAVLFDQRVVELSGLRNGREVRTARTQRALTDARLQVFTLLKQNGFLIVANLDNPGSKTDAPIVVIVTDLIDIYAVRDAKLARRARVVRASLVDIRIEIR